MSDWQTTLDRLARAQDVGMRVGEDIHTPFSPKPGSHDDGPDGGPFLGGIGGPAFSRGLTGRFDRWHLDPGVHASCDVPACFLAVSWEQAGQRHGRKLLIGEDGFAAADRAAGALFPVLHELYRGPLPFALSLESWSPAIPGDLAVAELPVTLFDVRVGDVAPDVTDISIALFWANLIGWHQFAQSPEHRAGLLWPASGNGGNHSVPLDLGPGTAAVAFRREAIGDGPDDRAETVIAVRGDTPSRELTFMAAQASTGVPAAEQRFTVGHVADTFLTTGRLPGTELSWRAHWHEPQGGAVAASLLSTGRATFVVANAWPEVAFGGGRRWRRIFQGDGATIATRVLAERDAWRERIDKWHDAMVARFADPRTAGAAINELSFVIGGGTAWVEEIAPAPDPDGAFGRARHFGLLEGFDTGYHYYNTSDLWVYAFAALSLTWPELAQNVFDDYLDTIPMAVDRDRPTYREGAVAPLLVAGKIPHDLGAPPDDPWVRLNGYALRDDPNLWKDHNPAFIAAYLLHTHLTGGTVSDRVWAALKDAAGFVARQIGGDGGVPEHEEFGDSTWDALAMKGVSAYTASICIAMWAGLARLAELRGDPDAPEYARRRDAAVVQLDALWNGEYFLANDKGKYGRAVMGDALWGLFFARRMGLGDLIDPDRVRSHLRAAHRYGFRDYADGRFGPLLVSEPGRQHYDQDGGESLQTNEVLAGAAWMHVAMLTDYGLADEAAATAQALRDTVYGGSGLQFRTPAAWDAEGRYRAPLNMRPLAVWFVEIAGATDGP